VVGLGVAGATWAAPSILALDKAFAAPGSCCAQLTMDLLAAPFGGNNTTAIGTWTTNGTNVTITRNQTDNINNTTCIATGATWTTGVISDCQQGGDSAGQIPMCATGADKASIVIKMSFSTPVRNLSFVLTDIDASNLASVEYQEEVTIAWTNSSGTSVPVYTPGANIISTGTANQYQANSASFNAGAAATTNNLTVDFQCGGKISSVTITDSNLNHTPGTSTTAGRYVGIAQIKWCI
jgi:hypothetical protein